MNLGTVTPVRSIVKKCQEDMYDMSNDLKTLSQVWVANLAIHNDLRDVTGEGP